MHRHQPLHCILCFHSHIADDSDPLAAGLHAQLLATFSLCSWDVSGHLGVSQAAVDQKRPCHCLRLCGILLLTWSHVVQRLHLGSPAQQAAGCTLAPLRHTERFKLSSLDCHRVTLWGPWGLLLQCCLKFIKRSPSTWTWHHGNRQTHVPTQKTAPNLSPPELASSSMPAGQQDQAIPSGGPLLWHACSHGCWWPGDTQDGSEAHEA